MKLTRIIFLTILIAFFVIALPLPKNLIYFKPDLVVLVVLYWTVTCSKQFHMLYVCLVGILLDVFFSYPLGSHAFGLILSSYILVKMKNRFLFFSVWKQGWVISLLLIAQKIILLFFIYLDQNTYDIKSIYYGLLVNYVAWVWLKPILDKTKNDAD